ncbi:MAG: TetR/AcrR family transcriptional regulator [Eubacterium sp.]|nr:TetR/AcrR family transcriptional regulator [Eubacterium sp.]
MKITKQEILDTALDIFAERGYDSTILKDISDRLNVTKSALYKHYESKEALWDALIDHVAQYYSENFGNAESIVIPNDMDELTELTLRQLRFTMHDETMRKVRKLFTMEQFRNERIKALAKKYFHSNIVSIYTTIFRGMAEKGLIQMDDPELLAFEYTAPISMLIQIYDREPDRESEIHRKIQEHIHYFLSVLRRDNKMEKLQK